MTANEPQTCSGVGFFYLTDDVSMKFGQQRVYLLLFFIVLEFKTTTKPNIKTRGSRPAGFVFSLISRVK